MKNLALLTIIIILASCSTSRPSGDSFSYSQAQAYSNIESPITTSLFEDKEATISEENIQKILNSEYALPEKLRISIVKIEGNQYRRNYYWTDEAYLKSQQSYLDLFTTIFNESSRTQRVSIIPDILLSSNPTFTRIRESAVRTQSDIVVIYSINSDLYSKYRLFSKSDIKAFATTQLIILDVRTGLIPFTTIVTKDFQSKKQENELSENEAASRIKNKAVLLTIETIGAELKTFLRKT